MLKDDFVLRPAVRASSLCALFFLLPALGMADTYYASPSGSGSRCSAGSRCALTTALRKMSGGDTLLLGDGTYHGQLRNIPGGKPSSLTVIKAENDGRAVIESSSGNTIPLHLASSYVRIEGIRFSVNIAGGSGVVAFITGSHNKLFRCSFVGTPTLTFSAGNDISNVAVSGSYNLLEDCWAWGGGRYKFLIYGGDGMENGSYNILRRCVARHDRENSHMTGSSDDVGNPQAAFCNYMAGHNIFQNCLAIDNDQPSHYQGYYIGPWFLEKGQHGARESIGSGVTIQDSIALNSVGPFVSDSGQYGDSSGLLATGNLYVSNSAAWSTSAGLVGAYNVWPGRTLTVDHVTLGRINGAYHEDQADNGAGFSGGGTGGNPSAKATNTIFYGIRSNTHNTGTALLNVKGDNDHNSFYDNSVNRSNSTAGPHDRSDTHPLKGSLKYLTRIESSSPLKGAGSDGTDIGATILFQRGVSGAAFGEAGYDTLTATPLWPWPNEERIKNEMSTYPSNWPAGNQPSPVRGFTAGASKDGSSQTLTKYIWEYLGHQIPAEIYSKSAGPAHR